MPHTSVRKMQRQHEQTLRILVLLLDKPTADSLQGWSDARDKMRVDGGSLDGNTRQNEVGKNVVVVVVNLVVGGRVRHVIVVVVLGIHSGHGRGATASHRIRQWRRWSERSNLWSWPFARQSIASSCLTDWT